MSAAHRHFSDMIPWWVNGRIKDADRLVFEDHLQHCEECRHEVAGQQMIMGNMADEPRVEYAPGASLQSLLTRINSDEGADASVAGTISTPKRRSARVIQSHWTRWLAAAAIVEAIGLGILASALWYGSPTTQQANDASYRTVTAVASTIPNASLRVVFSPTMTLSELGKLLQELKLEVVAGPSPAGVYSLSVNADETLANELAALRARSDVRFAETIGEQSSASH